MPDRFARTFGTALIAVLLAQDASAAPLVFPALPVPSVEETQPQTSIRLPIAPFADGALPARQVEGRLTRRVWRLAAPDVPTLDILSPLRTAIEAAGFTLIFECETTGCGGFDFRFNAGVLPEPQMHVDLGDFRFLSAQKPDGAALALMVSRSPAVGFIQLTEIEPADRAPALPPDMAAAVGGAALTPPPQDEAASLRIPVRPDPEAEAPASVAAVTKASDGATPDAGAIGETLLSTGSVTLEGLAFASGSSDLTEGRYASLEGLADWMGANPDQTVTLVGHTDASGSLDNNTALSKRRAQSVRERMIRTWGIAAARIDAQGVGPLAPRDTNLTESGRTKNRRVEAILTSDP